MIRCIYLHTDWTMKILSSKRSHLYSNFILRRHTSAIQNNPWTLRSGCDLRSQSATVYEQKIKKETIKTTENMKHHETVEAECLAASCCSWLLLSAIWFLGSAVDGMAQRAQHEPPVVTETLLWTGKMEAQPKNIQEPNALYRCPAKQMQMHANAANPMFKLVFADMSCKPFLLKMVWFLFLMFFFANGIETNFCLCSQFATTSPNAWNSMSLNKVLAQYDFVHYGVEKIKHDIILVKLLYFTGRGSKFIFQGMELSKVVVI